MFAKPSRKQDYAVKLSIETTAAIERWFSEAYGDPAAKVVRALPRTAGAFYEIRTAEGGCWLRVGGVLQRSVGEVEAEARTARSLVARRLRVAAPVARTDGSHAAGLPASIPAPTGGAAQVAVAYRHVPGDERSRPTAEEARALGRAVAELHALRGARIGSDTPLPLCEPIRSAGEALLWGRRWLPAADASWVEATLRASLERLERLASLGGSGLCHGDLRLGNVRFLDGEPTLLDLEALGRGPRAYDLGCLWRRRVIESDFTSVPPDWGWFRQGYSDTLSLEDDEWQALPLYALLRAIWTMCLPARPGTTWGTAWIADPDYWAAHLRMIRWFARAAELGAGD